MISYIFYLIQTHHYVAEMYTHNNAVSVGKPTCHDLPASVADLGLDWMVSHRKCKE